MIRRLQRKLILASMLSLLLVLLGIIGTANILNYRKMVHDADRVLQILVDNNGCFPDAKGVGNPENPKKDDRLFSPELPFESRFFSVRITEDGTASAEVGRIAAVDADTAISWAEQIQSAGNPHGFFGDYRYVVANHDEQTQIIFLDCGRSLSLFRTYLALTTGISAAGFGAVFVILLLLSHRIVAPISESYERQQRFITDAGHELKTPLTIIDADAEILEMEQGESEWLSDIRSQVTRLTDLTGDLIFLARMEESERHQRIHIDFPLSDVVEETVQAFQSRSVTQGKEISTSITPMLSLNGDESAIRHLVSVLMDNALKYSPSPCQIRVTLETQGHAIHFSVENPAVHLEHTQLRHLFDRFYRGDSSHSSQVGGYGIGLSIAKAVVNAHRGKITASSPDGSSVRIDVWLPVA